MVKSKPPTGDGFQIRPLFPGAGKRSDYAVSEKNVSDADGLTVRTVVTPDLCDEFPEVQVVEPGFRNFGAIDNFGGEIVTVKCFEDNSVVKQQVSLPGLGRVMVVDGGGSKRNALLGDMLAEKAASNGWAGLIIYGCIRDADVIAKTALGVQALGTHPRKTEKRDVGDLNIAVTFGGVTFHPGHFVYADNNGIIVSEKALF
jgi:regulator of ribonuclease activity A